MDVETKQGIGGRDMIWCNGLEGGRVIIGPWQEGSIAITANAETVIIKKEDFSEIVDWLDSWGYLDYGNPI